MYQALYRRRTLHVDAGEGLSRRRERLGSHVKQTQQLAGDVAEELVPGDRLTSLDQAFQSRIHFTFKYKVLSNEARLAI